MIGPSSRRVRFDIGRPPYLDGVYDGVADWVVDKVKGLP
jgi:hypothetical protein